MSDKLLTFALENRAVRGQLIRLDESFKTIIEQHHYPEPLIKHLGEALVVSVLLMAPLKLEGQITVQFDGQGPIKMLVAKCNHHYEIRGLAQFEPSLTEHDLHATFSAGRLAVTVEFDHSTKPYQSIIALNGGSVSQAMESYFIQSEQLPTRLMLATKGTSAVGFMLQQLPDGAESGDWEHALALANTLTETELLELPFEALLNRLYHEDPVRIYPEKTINFKCPCSPERMQAAIKAMGRNEAEHHLTENKAIIVTCEYCNNEYSFVQSDVENIFQTPH